MADKIEAQWSILPGGTRRAEVGDLVLVSTNGRTDNGYGPVRWMVIIDDGTDRALVAQGEVWQGTRYDALVRQAMFDAEQAAKAYVS